MFELTFLGTSASAPSVHRGLSAQIISYRDQRYLIDCGEGTQRQILRSGVGFRRIDRILITHGHLDHILGLGGLLSTFSRWEAIDHLQIWGGRWALERVRDLVFGVVLRGNRPAIDIELIPVDPGVIIEEDGLSVHAFPVTHRGPDVFGYAFEEESRRPFLPGKAETLGVPVGPVRKELVEGRSVTLADGKVIEPDQVLGPSRRGARLVHVGDCGRTDDILQACTDADGLVIEATYLEYERDLADKFGHLTARQAAQLARDAGVGHLYLTHISRRYREREIHEEAAEVFPNVSVARDFDQFQIRRSEQD
ncbi:MAG: ribonuclease Z [Anaerolineales bacterium]